MPINDEYKAWLATPKASDNNVEAPLNYWYSKRFQYPRLSTMALDLLTIQPMSMECERLFSVAGQMVTPLRTRVDSRVIEMCQVPRSWLRAVVITELDQLLVSPNEEHKALKITRMSDEEYGKWATRWLTKDANNLLEAEIRWNI